LVLWAPQTCPGGGRAAAGQARSEQERGPNGRPPGTGTRTNGGGEMPVSREANRRRGRRHR